MTLSGGSVIRRFAYADPPYPGMAKRLYGKHRDYAGEVDHRALIAGLEEDFPDGWALSTSSSALPAVLALCPPPEASKRKRGSFAAGSGVRVCAWTRSVMPAPPARVMFCWEPVVIRIPHWRQRTRGDLVRDTLHACAPYGFMGNEITGQKPTAFARWLFDLLGAVPGDELVDVFPGSGAVGREWESCTRQERLNVA
jgi:hypothetical protein